MAMKKSIGRTLAQIDVVANTSVCIHEDFFNSHPCSQQLFLPPNRGSKAHCVGLLLENDSGKKSQRR
jgi:hypothetical protein